MTPDRLLRLAVRPALSMLPARMTSPESEAMLMAIAWQESRMQHRRQVLGPARSYWQAEQDGGFRGVLTHRATAGYARVLCDALDVPATHTAVYVAVEYQDVLAAGFARLLLWTLPGRLPRRAEQDAAWSQYLDAWRPGRPHARTWPTSWDIGWRAVETA